MTRVLVLGGTGMLGVPVVRQLKADGFDVRVLARDPKKAQASLGDGLEIVKGDVTDTARLEAAMADCEVAHVSVGGAIDRLSAENVAKSAPKQGVSRIGYVSGSTAFEENRWFPMTAQKLDAEAAVRKSGVPFTVFCPTWPMEQLPRFARGGKPSTIGKQPHPWHWFAADDYARMVSTAYQREDAAGKRLFIHGPEAMTTKAALERYCLAMFGETASVSVMPIWLAKILGTVTRNEVLKFAAGLMDYFEKVGELGDPSEANALLGAPTTTLDAWIEGQRAAAS